MSQGILMGNLKGLGLAEIVVDLPSVTNGETANVLVDLPGALPGDFIIPNAPALSTGLFVTAGASVSKDQIEIQVANITDAPIDNGEATFGVMWFRPVSRPTHVKQ